MFMAFFISYNMFYSSKNPKVPLIFFKLPVECYAYARGFPHKRRRNYLIVSGTSSPEGARGTILRNFLHKGRHINRCT